MSANVYVYPSSLGGGLLSLFIAIVMRSLIVKDVVLMCMCVKEGGALRRVLSCLNTPTVYAYSQRAIV